MPIVDTGWPHHLALNSKLVPNSALRLVIYDKTCGGHHVLPGLSRIWSTGTSLYRGLGRVDAARGVSSWTEALQWLRQIRPEKTIEQVQFWGHGRWGRALVGEQWLDASALSNRHDLYDPLCRVRERLSSPAGIAWWFRTCETFGQSAGHSFARAWTRFFDRPAAGHTHVIGFYQSGLHSLAPGAEPTWPVEEGVVPHRVGDDCAPGMPSGPRQPNTITCLHGRVPKGF